MIIIWPASSPRLSGGVKVKLRSGLLPEGGRDEILRHIALGKAQEGGSVDETVKPISGVQPVLTLWRALPEAASPATRRRRAVPRVRVDGSTECSADTACAARSALRHART